MRKRLEEGDFLCQALHGASSLLWSAAIGLAFGGLDVESCGSGESG